ncbi:MAG: hypothetical protein IJR10_03635 [Clostridia bacterium]|nr:hypothetical protein [Clostridia bacterium]
MKKNVIFRIAAIVLMCTLVTACFASSTFAKYTSTATLDNNKLTVAKWDIKYNDTQIATTTPTTVSVNLFDEIKDSDGSAENDVSANLIAPGTKGSVDFAGVTNDSEVTANVTIKVKSITNASNIPVELKKGATVLAAGDTIYTGDVAIGASLDTATIGTLDWEWKFEDNRDAADTALGIAARDTAPEYIVEFEIVVNQVD